MLRLYGIPFSNFYNMVKLAMLEKGFDFEEVNARPNDFGDRPQDNPAGKIPMLECREGCLTETLPILEFLEDVSYDFPLLSQDRYSRAQMRQCCNFFTHYVESSAREHYSHLFFGADLDQSRIAPSLATAKRGMLAVERLSSRKPWLMGEFSLVDIVGFFTMQYTLTVAEKVWQWDIAADHPWLTDWYQAMRERPMVGVTLSDCDRALAALRQMQKMGQV